MNILMVYPRFTTTFWGQKHIIRRFLGKKAAFPPLGLLTVAAMLPSLWRKRLVDLNVRSLEDEEILWTDYVFISAMITQIDSVKEVIARCKKLGKKIVLGGQVLEVGQDEFPAVAHFFEGEVENIFADFLDDLLVGRAKRVYSSAGNFPDLAICPIPLWELVDLRNYSCVLVQWGRGCPWNCEFCNVAAINGHKPRVKSPEQFLHELNAIHRAGFRGRVMLADDNFIGNKRAVKEMLPLLIDWQKSHKYPFGFAVEVDITLSDDEELMNMMIAAGFGSVFLGIETPNEASLIECGKVQNLGRNLIADVRKLHRHGFLTMSGFIVSFDHDGSDIFDQHLKFYHDAGIVFPMIGVLQVPKRTRLFDRMNSQGRLLSGASGNNTDVDPNFIPKMPLEELKTGYKRMVAAAYSPKNYYLRTRVFLEEYNPAKRAKKRISSSDFRAFAMSLVYIGLFGGFEISYYYWKALLFSLFKHRKSFPLVAALQISGWQFQQEARRVQKS